MKDVIASYIIGDGVRDTIDGNYVIEFEELDKRFFFLPGTVLEMAEEIEQALANCDMLESVQLLDNSFSVKFYLRYCPYIECVRAGDAE